MQTLTLQAVRAAGRKAYETGKLTAQAPDPDDRRCEYVRECVDGVTRNCVVGAAMSQATINALLELPWPDNSPVDGANGCGVRGLLNIKDVPVGFAEVDSIARLQEYHDNWSGRVDHEPYKATFLAALYSDEPVVS